MNGLSLEGNTEVGQMKKGDESSRQRENAGEVGVHSTLRNLQDAITAFANSFRELVEDD